jgi:hypothetical protein
MSVWQAGAWTEQLWPYLVLVLVGFLPNEVWRMAGLVIARRLDESSEILVWVRAVATAVLAAVIAKLTIFAPGTLATIPLSVRLFAVAAGFLAFSLVRRSVFVGVLTGVGALILGALVAEWIAAR